MRKGQFVFNFLRDYMGESRGLENPYPRCHWVLFNISDEYWTIIELEYAKFKSNPREYTFPSKPFGDSIISKEHGEAINRVFLEL